MSILWKNFLIFVLCFFLFLSVIFAVIFTTVTKDIYNHTLQSIIQQADTSARRLKSEFDGMSAVFYNLYFDKTIKEELEKSPEDINYSLLLRKLDLLMLVSDYRIFSIYLYDHRNQVLITSEADDYYISDKPPDWFNNDWAITQPKMQRTQSLNHAKTPLVSYTGWLYRNFFEKELAYISVNISQASMQGVFPRTPVYEGTKRLILDQSGSVVASRPRDTAPQQSLHALPDGEPVVISIDKIDYLAISHTITPHQWQYIELLPKEQVFSSLHRLKSLLIAIFALFSIAMLVVSFFVFRSISQPITELSLTVAGYRTQNPYPLKAKQLQSTDEIGQLSRGTKEMMDRIDYLIEEVYQANLYKKETQLRRFQEGMNPHFIYNILDSIVWTLKFGETQKGIQVIQQFSTYLRDVLRQYQEFITLEETKHRLDNYVALANFLVEIPIDYQFLLPSDWSSRKVLSFLLEPLVENAFKHAFHQTGGQLVVSVYEQDDCLFLTVADNGFGMTQDRLDWLRQHIDTYDMEQWQEHFGLASVQHRIWLNYGKSYRMKFFSEAGVGTVITIKLPLDELS